VTDDTRLDDELARLSEGDVGDERWGEMVTRAAAEVAPRLRRRREGLVLKRLALATAVACGLAWLTGAGSIQTQNDFMGPVPPGTAAIRPPTGPPGMLGDGFMALYEEPETQAEPDKPPEGEPTEEGSRSSSAPEVPGRRPGHV